MVDVYHGNVLSIRLSLDLRECFECQYGLVEVELAFEFEIDMDQSRSCRIK